MTNSDMLPFTLRIDLLPSDWFNDKSLIEDVHRSSEYVKLKKLVKEKKHILSYEISKEKKKPHIQGIVWLPFDRKLQKQFRDAWDYQFASTHPRGYRSHTLCHNLSSYEPYICKDNMIISSYEYTQEELSILPTLWKDATPIKRNNEYLKYMNDRISSIEFNRKKKQNTWDIEGGVEQLIEYHDKEQYKRRVAGLTLLYFKQKGMLWDKYICQKYMNLFMTQDETYSIDAILDDMSQYLDIPKGIDIQFNEKLISSYTI